jgi:hypothetical protein
MHTCVIFEAKDIYKEYVKRKQYSLKKNDTISFVQNQTIVLVINCYNKEFLSLVYFFTHKQVHNSKGIKIQILYMKNKLISIL